jgi:hypothetical protein
VSWWSDPSVHWYFRLGSLFLALVRLMLLRLFLWFCRSAKWHAHHLPHLKRQSSASKPAYRDLAKNLCISAGKTAFTTRQPVPLARKDFMVALSSLLQELIRMFVFRPNVSTVSQLQRRRLLSRWHSREWCVCL